MEKKNWQYSWIWSLYIVAVLIALARRQYSASSFCDVMIIVVALFCVITISLRIEQFGIGVKFLYMMGIVSAAAIFVQYILRDAYNAIYWRLFTQKWEEYVEFYYNEGYYTGLHSVPGQAAGAILFSIGILVCYCLLTKYSKKKIKKDTILLRFFCCLRYFLREKRGC
ncbi:MAG: hypothetical protein LUI01_04340 [Firmicutes bacterium]|nr:hypothetical protein [Bacillota bacterium]